MCFPSSPPDLVVGRVGLDTAVVLDQALVGLADHRFMAALDARPAAPPGQHRRPGGVVAGRTGRHRPRRSVMRRRSGAGSASPPRSPASITRPTAKTGGAEPSRRRNHTRGCPWSTEPPHPNQPNAARPRPPFTCPTTPLHRRGLGGLSPTTSPCSCASWSAKAYLDPNVAKARTAYADLVEDMKGCGALAGAAHLEGARHEALTFLTHPSAGRLLFGDKALPRTRDRRVGGG